MTKHYVAFKYPGVFFPETSVIEIKSRDEKFDIPKGCYGYHFFDQEEIEHNGEILTGEVKNESGTTFFGKKYSIDDIRKNHPEKGTLIRNLISNGYKFAVDTVTGNWQPVDDEDTVIEVIQIAQK